MLELNTILIIITLVISLIGTIVALFRLEYARKQYDISVKMLKESRRYWQKRMERDKKEQRRT